MNCQLLRCAMGLLIFAMAPLAKAYPVDPRKEPVRGVDLRASKDFILAYDSGDQSIVYYAPKGGRVALMNGQPLLGFAAAGSGGFLNAQFEFGVFGTEREALFQAIQNAGYQPRPFPYVKTTVVPITPIDPATGAVLCESFEDASTGETVEDCSARLFTRLSFSTRGPTLGEFVPVTLQLNAMGALVYQAFLRSGNSLQIMLDADYYTAGSAFRAKVTVNYDRLFENFHAYAAYHDGVCTDIQMEAFWRKEGLCVDRRPEECSVRVEYWDGRGNPVNTVTLDPDSEDGKQVYQAIQRLRDKLQEEMLTPIAQRLDPADTARPAYGFKLSAKYERQHRSMHAEFNFDSPRGVNMNTTVIPAAISCITVSDSGNVSRNREGDCALYWQGSLGWEDILAREQRG